MPVLLKAPDSAVFSNFDVEHLVSDVRERLCLNQSHGHDHARMCSSSSSHARRCAPYPLAKRPNHNMCEHCRNKHFSSPNSFRCQQSQGAVPDRQHAISKPEPCCSNLQRKLCPRSRSTGTHSHSQCTERRDSSYQDPRLLLEKLLAEQSLIQEAVRRLQTRNSRDKMCSAQKLFSLVSDADDEDSNDQFGSQQTLFSVTMSESEDDAVSQHSVDL